MTAGGCWQGQIRARGSQCGQPPTTDTSRLMPRVVTTTVATVNMEKGLDPSQSFCQGDMTWGREAGTLNLRPPNKRLYPHPTPHLSGLGYQPLLIFDYCKHPQQNMQHRAEETQEKRALLCQDSSRPPTAPQGDLSNWLHRAALRCGSPLRTFY